MKINDILKKIGEINGALIDNYNNLNENQIDNLAGELNKLHERITSNSILSEKKDNVHKRLYTVKEAADILGVSTKTIYRNVADGVLKPRGKGGNTVFYYDDLVHCDFIQKSPKAYCITKTIYLNSKKGDIAVYNQGEMYEIVKENKIWNYLFNEKWGGSFRIGKKQFRKNFSVKGQFEYDAKIYRVL